jgi:hypothetical protein
MGFADAAGPPVHDIFLHTDNRVVRLQQVHIGTEFGELVLFQRV